MRSGWFDQRAVARELERHVRGETDASNLLFNVAQRDAWDRKRDAAVTDGRCQRLNLWRGPNAMSG